MSDAQSHPRARHRRPWPPTVRGLVLWLFGWAFIIVGGLNYLGTTLPALTRGYLEFALTLTRGAAWPYGLIFVVVGTFAIVAGYLSDNLDQWGYRAAAIWSGLWATGYVCGWLFYDAPLRAVGSAVAWVLYSAILLTCLRIPKVAFEDLAERTR
ncbi:hypothetical protein [Nocardioides sp. 503]|uniref:hypothetical protein n=1 Tax=Nocardioides sp. 503 TaxID=2508326 RepID=UPI00106F940D|nr:hypothetical protein [Nocardioides sp. 503]